MGLLEPLPFKRPNFLRFVFLFFVFLQKFFQCKSYHFSQDILLHIGDSYLKHKNICLFETQRLMLADIIRIKNNRSEHQNGYQTLINYTDMISSNSAFGSNFSYVNSLANAIVGFVETSSKDQLEMFYIKICSKPYRERCKLYQYVLFNIFLAIIDSQSQQHKIETLIKTGLHIE